MKTKLGELLLSLGLSLSGLSHECGLSKSYLSRLANERSLRPQSAAYLKIKTALIENHSPVLRAFFPASSSLEKTLDAYFFPARHGIGEFFSPEPGFLLSLAGSHLPFLREVLSALSPYLRKDRSSKVRVLLSPDYGKTVYALSEAFFFLFLEGRISFYESDREVPSFALVGKKILLHNAREGKEVYHFLEVDAGVRSFYEGYFLAPRKDVYLREADFFVAYQRFLEALTSSHRGFFLLENPSFLYMDDTLFASFGSVLAPKVASLLRSARETFPLLKKSLAVRLDDLSYKRNRSDPIVDLLLGHEHRLSEEEYRSYLQGLGRLSGRRTSLYRLRNTIFSSIVIIDGLVAVFPRRFAIREAPVLFLDPQVVRAYQTHCRKDIRLEPLAKDKLSSLIDEE